MKFSYSPYELKFKSALGKSVGMIRKGALLRIEFQDLGFGYADCHPWPELGDLPLESQLRSLRDDVPTSLLLRSLDFAFRDAQARAAGLSLFSEGYESPENHLLLGDVSQVSAHDFEYWAHEGFTLFKLKAGKDPVADAQRVNALSREAAHSGLKLRIDLNESLSMRDAQTFMDCVCANDGAKGIDFIEDPTAFNPSDWHSLKDLFPLRLALDRAAGSAFYSLDFPGNDGGNKAVDVVVIKPAVEDPQIWIERLKNSEMKCVLTTYLDHPLGNAGAAWWAGEFQRQVSSQMESCGLLSYLFFQDSAEGYEESVAGGFIRQLSRKQTRWVPPRGRGLGFDHELERVGWKVMQ